MKKFITCIVIVLTLLLLVTGCNKTKNLTESEKFKEEYESLNNKKTSYESKSYEFSFSSPEASYTSTKTFSALKIKAINQLKDLSEVQVVSVLAYMKILTEEMAASLKEKKKDSSVDLAEVEKINAVYDKIPKEEQLKFAKEGSKTVCEALKNDTW